MASWLKKYGLAALMMLGGKNVQAQEGGAPLSTDNDVKAAANVTTPIVENADSTYVLQPSEDIKQTNSNEEIKKRPTIDVSIVDKLGQVWLKTKEGKQAINNYIDAVMAVMPEAQLPVLTSDDVYALKAMCKISADEKCIGMFPNSSLEYDAQDLLTMQPDMVEKLDSCSRNYVKPERMPWGDCAQAVKNYMGLTGLVDKDDMEKIASAYQLIDYFRNSENFELRKLKNAEDVYKVRPGTFMVLDKGETPHGHTLLAIDMKDNQEAQYTNEYGEIYDYSPIGQRADKESPNIKLQRGNGKKYGAPYGGFTILTKIGDRTFNKELVNEAKEEQIAEFRSTFIAKEDAVPLLKAPTPTQLLKRWADKKAELQEEQEGELSYVAHPKFRWLANGVKSYHHKYKRGGRRSRSYRSGTSRLAQKRSSRGGRQ